MATRFIAPNVHLVNKTVADSKGLRVILVHESLVPYYLADRLREAQQARLAREARAMANDPQRNESKKSDRWPRLGLPENQSWMPRLRGYPIDREFARR